MTREFIRNFCIIAHIDHGKSTLADRFLELSGVVEQRKLSEQMLDHMDLERERGITIKAKTVHLTYEYSGQQYILNLIDTPGHVDFTYEVEKSLRASDGAILLVDATQGIEAQTLANFYLALENNLRIIPVINKIDLPNAEPSRIITQLEDAFGFRKDEISLISAKDGNGVNEVIIRIIKEISPPQGNAQLPLKAILFDTSFDPYRGIILFVRIFEGELQEGDEILLMHHRARYKVEELGIFCMEAIKKEKLGCGEVGYLYCNIKNPKEVVAGDTITTTAHPTSKPFEGYKEIRPMVFCGIFPSSPKEHTALRDAVEKMNLSDPSFIFEPDSLGTLGHGFRCGFLGLLHMDVIQERLEREFGLDLIITSPNVLYKVVTIQGQEIEVESPHKLPDITHIKKVLEPYARVTLLTPLEYIEPLCNFSKGRRGTFIKMEYLGKDRIQIVFELPLAEVIVDYYDKIKSITRGFASLDYEIIEYRDTAITRIDILFNKKPVEAFSLLVFKEQAYQRARSVVDKLKELIPRQMFEINIQAAVGSTVIASSRVPALKKNVTAKCYGGDITRKRKLWEKQKEGKKKLKQFGNVQVPRQAFLEVLKM